MKNTSNQLIFSLFSLWNCLQRSTGTKLAYSPTTGRERKNLHTKERSVTLPAIHTDLPDAVGNTIGKTGGAFATEAPGSSPARESLREVTDQAKLSSLSPRIRAALNEMTGGDGTITATLASNIDRLQEGFLDTLYTSLASGDIDLTEKLTLRLDGDNTLAVAGDHPEKMRVEQLLAENPALSEAFGEIASQSEIMRDIADIGKVMTRQTGVEAYSASRQDQTAFAVYQMSLKGDMSHFYFAKG